ncbi:MAG TPA: hypothetical protein PLX08_10210 [Bacteroidales bacterium]|jgi:hypothetical protein|nr:hypothetical protein [Bacteroidales bacterium]
MNKLVISFVALVTALSAFSQTTRNDVLQGLEKGQNAISQGATAIIKKATRLFRDKDDLTSVIMVLKVGTVVNVVSSDSTFMKIDYEGNTGFIYSRHAEIEKSAVSESRPEVSSAGTLMENSSGTARTVERSGAGRYEYLENKYGRSLAGRIYSGKIWKGMRSEMVKDSWGSPRKINKIINNSMVKEEWYYNNTVLFFQNNILVNWGPERD